MIEALRERRRLPDAAQPPVAGVEALLGLAERLLSAPDAGAAGAVLLEVVVSTYGFPRAVLLASQDGRLTVAASHGLSEAGPPRGRCDSPVVVRAHEEGTTRHVAGLDPTLEPWIGQVLPAGADLLVVPVAYEDRRLGALVVQLPTLRDAGWRRTVVEPLERAASCAARALRTLWRLEHLERLAATDDLTMIDNRRSFDHSLERELARSARSDEPVSLVMLDLDGFKEVNDIYGHPAGDEALRNVAAALSIACRDLDTPARYGGEEFAVILPDCGPAQSLIIAERLRSAVAGAPAVVPLTASAGVATVPAHAGNAETLVRAADDALLRSKRSGRDRTTQAPFLEPIHLLQQVVRLDEPSEADARS